MSLLGFKLVLVSEGENKLILRVPLSFRLITGGIACVILIFLISGARAGIASFFARENTLLLIFFLLSFLSGIYKDRWIFNREQDVCERQIGLLFLFSLKRMKLSSIKRVEVSEYVRGSTPGSGPLTTRAPRVGVMDNRRRRFVTLTLVNEQDEILKLENASSLRTKSIVSMGKRLADFCSIEFLDRTSPSVE